MGPRHAALVIKVDRIREHRSKLIHGQVSGEYWSRDQMLGAAALLSEWIDLLARKR